MSWHKIRFGEFAEIQPSISFKRGEKYPFIPMEIVSPHCRNIQSVETRMWEGGGGARFQNGDTIFARITPCLEHGKTAQVKGLEKDMGFGSTEFFVFRNREDISDPNFIYYLSCTDTIREPAIKSMTGASGRQRAQRSVLEEIIVSVPIAIETQKQISFILSNYDDMIENNQRRIALLEQSARMLYKEWFVNFRFPGHEHVKITNCAPDGWEKKPLGEIAKLNYGKALKAEDRIPGIYPVYGSSGIIGFNEKPFCQGPAIIVGRKGNVGSVYWSDCDFFPIDTVYFIDVNSSNLYLYYALSHMQFISTDVAVPGLNRDFAHSREIVMPDTKIFDFFEETVRPIQAQIYKLKKYNESLARARDQLLPLLMKGEIAV